MRCLIVDDEEMSRMVIQTMCEKLEDLEVVAVCTNAADAINVLRNEEVDVIFLDVEMPEMSGIDLIKNLPELPAIVFTTSNKEYALEAFEHRATDYLQKPVTLPRFIKAVDTVREKLGKGKSKTSNDIFVKVDGRLVRLDLREVLYIESIGDYVLFHTEKKEKFIVHSTLKNIDDKINNAGFLKVHRSFIVNLSKIVDIQEGNLVIKDKVIPISRAHRAALLSKINTLS
ncbi:MAG: LytR/AlgR family response regulator transcription factor [Bacteroidota bacterium]